MVQLTVGAERVAEAFVGHGVVLNISGGLFWGMRSVADHAHVLSLRGYMPVNGYSNGYASVASVLAVEA